MGIKLLCVYHTLFLIKLLHFLESTFISLFVIFFYLYRILLLYYEIALSAFNSLIQNENRKTHLSYVSNMYNIYMNEELGLLQGKKYIRIS